MTSRPMRVCRHPPLDAATRARAIAQGRRLLAHKARTFHLATALLPAELRDDIAVLYAFCRIADDIVDEAHDSAALDRLEAELAGEVPARDVVATLREMARRRDFPLSHARTLLQGVRCDLTPIFISDDAQLLAYAYRVASTVGLMLSRILGVTDRAAAPFAIDLGLAMQLTNIVRDVREDALRGRVYLPADRLARVGVEPEALVRGTAPREAVRQVCFELLDMADRYYLSAERGFRFIPVGARFGVAVAERAYASIGWRMRRKAHHPLDGRIVVSGREKIWRVAEALVTSMRCSLAGSLMRPHDGALHLLLRTEVGFDGRRF